MILYGSSMSPFVRKVLAFAGEKGVELDVRPIGLGDQNPDFRAASPFGKMPALVDGDFSLADSSAIVHYLEARHPTPALIPAEPKLRGQCIWFDEFADTIFSACGSKIFFNRIVAPIFLKHPGDAAVAEAAETRELPPILDYIERVVPDGDGYLVGDGLTLADLAVASPFANLEHLRVALDHARYSRTLAFVRRILARPSFAGWIEREQKFFAKLGA